MLIKQFLSSKILLFEIQFCKRKHKDDRKTNVSTGNAERFAAHRSRDLKSDDRFQVCCRTSWLLFKPQKTSDVSVKKKQDFFASRLWKNEAVCS